MSYSFNDVASWTNYNYAFNADDSFIAYMWSNQHITFFDGWFTGDYMNLCANRNESWKPNKIYVDISQVGDNGWAWYKLKVPIFNADNWWTYYHPDVIMDLVIVSDWTNWWTQSWFIEFEIPDNYWNYWNLRGKSKWYSWQIVLENLWNTVTPMIARITQYDYAVHIVDEVLTFEDIQNYLQTIDSSLSTKNVNQYYFNCAIHISGWTFTSKSEQVTFGRNFDFYMGSDNAQYGELSKWQPVNWTSIKFTCFNGDFWWYIGNTYSKLYGLRYETIYEAGSDFNHWHWGWYLWSRADQDIAGLYIHRMRSVNMSQTSNVILSPTIIQTYIEPIGAIIDWWITINASQAIRALSSSNFQYVHNYDFTAINSRGVQNWASWRYPDTQNYFVDCKWNTSLDYWNYQIYPTQEYIDEQYTNILYSLILKTTTPDWTAITDMVVKLKDKNWLEVFNWTTNTDWYVNDLSWTETVWNYDYINDWASPFPWYSDWKYNNGLHYRELMMTSWVNTGIRKIIKIDNTTSRCYIHVPFLSITSIWDRFIKVPYVTSVRSQADMTSWSGYKPEIKTEQWPFTLTIKKWDYSYLEVLDIQEPINRTIVLEKKKVIINTDLENLT